MYGEAPNVKRAAEFFRSLITPEEWRDRRLAIAQWFYSSLIGEAVDPTGKGRFFDSRDLFGWQLFLAEAFTDHPWNYDPIYGSRVIPIFTAIGAALDLLLKVDGFAARAAKLVGSDKGQPNGPLFEMLVAAAYAREGAKVAFRDQTPGQAKSHDLDVELKGKKWAIECKRMEGGEYHEEERARMRELWKEPCLLLVRQRCNAILDVKFKVELKDVPDDYLLQKTERFLRRSVSYNGWIDRIAEGTIQNLSLEPLQRAIQEKGHLLHPSPKFSELLMGRYERSDNTLMIISAKPASNPHFLSGVNFATACRWISASEEAIDKKARDIMKRLSEANSQLPADVSGVVHIGFEALGEDQIEQRRFEKIIETACKFERGQSGLQVVYCHYFAPDPAPDEVWAIDETVQWFAVSPDTRPLEHGTLLPSDTEGRPGVHWKAPEASRTKLGRALSAKELDVALIADGNS
ncbi:transposase [Bradyrhizobium sp. STM 3843]|uniref:transposase n=1 Tax=Bradyrhizobium sp. STM 3843 TaxID=551947 RepID=UPI0003111F5B|nr:transposase [Bradyrhizobium sp. STM 3843]